MPSRKRTNIFELTEGKIFLAAVFEIKNLKAVHESTGRG